MVSFVWLVSGLAGQAAAQAVYGLNVIQKQLDARAANFLDPIYDSLSRQDADFINVHLRELSAYDGSDCDKCKNKIRYGKQLLEHEPDKKHLISLLLFRYCIVEHSGSQSKCDNKDFFVTTNTRANVNAADVASSFDGWSGTASVSFHDNDFLQMLLHFNESSELDLEYYCYYKSSGACDLPGTPDISRYNLDSLWPDKQEKHYSEPVYNKTDRETFNVLHVSDFHNQLRFQVGAEANCSQGLCCLPETYNEDLVGVSDYNFTTQLASSDGVSFYPDAHYDESGTYIKGEYYDFPAYRGWDFGMKPATTFGSYACDPPEVLLNNSLKIINETIGDNKYEFSLFTGDIVDHDLYHDDANFTKTEEIRSYQIMKHFLQDIPVYPTLGNHDAFPYGQMATLSTSNHLNLADSDYHWNEELMAQLWTSNGWLPANQQLELRNHYAGFLVTTHRGLKVISLNSNCWYQKNLWSYINLETEFDSFGQWQFLIDELVESEANDQRVWILAHIPSGDYDALPIQSHIFAKVVERFSPYTIANVFFGHTHRDQFKILFSSDGEPVNMAWVSQAITPLGTSNPSWRYYEVEDESFNIVNVFHYYTPLNETFTNHGDEPEWKFEYSARDTYDPNHTWPERAALNATFWNDYVLANIKNETNVDFNQLYTNLLHRFAPDIPDCNNNSRVSDECYTVNWCYSGTFLSDEYQKCQRVEE